MAPGDGKGTLGGKGRGQRDGVPGRDVDGTRRRGIHARRRQGAAVGLEVDRPPDQGDGGRDRPAADDGKTARTRLRICNGRSEGDALRPIERHAIGARNRSGGPGRQGSAIRVDRDRAGIDDTGEGDARRTINQQLAAGEVGHGTAEADGLSRRQGDAVGAGQRTRGRRPDPAGCGGEVQGRGRKSRAGGDRSARQQGQPAGPRAVDRGVDQHVLVGVQGQGARPCPADRRRDDDVARSDRL